MARFSLGGDEDGDEEIVMYRSKRPRRSNPILYNRRRPDSIFASTSNSAAAVNPAANSASPPPLYDPTVLQDDPVEAEEESEWESVGESESDTSLSDASSEEESGGGQEEQDRTGNEAQTPVPTEAPVVSTPNGNGSGRGSEGSGVPVSVTLTDTDVLDCPICFEPLCSPVYQCENGHLACSSCCTIMRNKCPSCCWPIGYNRCRAIEKVLESVRVKCPNIQHGCTETFTYSKKSSHEKTCKYTPCSCPQLGCNYIGTSKLLYSHVALVHSSSTKQFLFNSETSLTLEENQKHVFLIERSQKIIFVLSRCVESLGSFVDVVCVAPNSDKTRFLHDITAVVGESSIKLKTYAECMPKWTPQHRSKLYLLVPNDVVSTNGQLRLDLIIWGDSAGAS